MLLVVGIVVAAGCATSPRSNPQPQVASPSDGNSPSESAFDELEAELAQKQVSVADPLEPVNRVMFGVNDVVYFWILKPVLRGYVYAVSTEARTGIRNFFHNVATPARLVNCILQGRNAEADIELRRFAVNTVVGALGLGDPARDRWGLKPAEEDLGQTLAVYGLGDGFYLVWPLLGPSTLRDSVGMVGDAFLDPVRYVPPEAVSIGIAATGTVNDTSFRLGEYESLKAATVDPYIAMRQAYLQYRKKQIRGEDYPTEPNSVKP
jgi:phospholipid-binding lipoprotein MlaA